MCVGRMKLSGAVGISEPRSPRITYVLGGRGAVLGYSRRITLDGVRRGRIYDCSVVSAKFNNGDSSYCLVDLIVIID